MQSTTSVSATIPPANLDGPTVTGESLLIPDEPPPPFSLAIANEGRSQPLGSGAGPPKLDDIEPPSYDVAVKLPTYEEAQQDKLAAEQQRFHRSDPRMPHAHDPRHYNFMSSFSHPVGESQFDSNTAELALGTDVYFFASFLIAFLFNWIGFLMLMCACHTVAGRYGALAGFGLSLAKWTLIVKHSTDLASNDNNWLWWLIMAFGVLICVRAIIQYLCIKREWHRLSRAAQERVVFFY